MSSHSFDLEVQLPRLPGGLAGRVWALRGSDELARRYVGAVLTELGRRADDRRWTYRSVGSVTLQLSRGGVPPRLLGEVVGALQRTFAFSPGCRITCVCLPDDGGDFRALAAGGVERVFLPVDSFDSRTLRRLGSEVGAGEAQALIGAAIGAGLQSVAIKLLFGTPGQALAQFRTDLSNIIVHSPHEVVFAPAPGSAVFGRRSISVKQLAKMKGIIEAVMTGLGYDERRLHHYVRSGVVEGNTETRGEGDRLALGAGAVTVTHDGFGRRITASNESGVREYLAAVERDGRAWRREAVVTPEEQVGAAIAEMFYQRSGLDLRAIQSRFGIDVERACPGVIDVLIDAHFINRQGDEVELTPTGHVAIDDVVAQFQGGLALAPV